MPNSVTYQGITLVEPLVIEHSRQPMFSDDGTTYHYTAHLLQVTGTYNPATNSYSGPPPKASNQALPATTYAAIRHQLEQPQGTLVYTDGTQQVLNVTGPDCYNGPYVKVHDIVEQMGSQTYVVSLSILTYMNEVSFFVGNNVSPILSHTYDSVDQLDEDSYLARTISGEATFRTDVMAKLNAQMDAYRSYFWHPTPPGMKLDAATVSVDSDGAHLSYQLLFRQKPIVVVVPGVTRIEMFDTFSTSRKNPADSALGIAQGAASLNAWSTFESGLGLAPGFYRRTHIRVWGYPTTSKQQLTFIATRLLNTRWLGTQNDLNVSSVTHDIMGRYVELIYERSLGGIAGVWESIVPGIIASGALGAGVAGAGGVQPNDAISRAVADTLKVFVGKPDDCWWSPGVLADVNIVPTAFGPNLPGDPVKQAPGQGCRGTYLGQLVMSALLGTAPPKNNVTPPRPALPPPVKALVPAGGQ